MDHSRQERWGEWSEWIPDPAQDRHWRWRQDAQGNIDYDFYNPHPAEQTAPRGSDVEEIANTFSNINLSGHNAHYTQEAAYTHRPQGSGAAYGGSSRFKGKAVDQHVRYKPKDRGHPPKKYRNRAGKGHAEAEAEGAATSQFDHEPFYRKPGAPSGADYTPASDHAFVNSPAYQAQAYDSSSYESAYEPGTSGDSRFHGDQEASVHREGGETFEQSDQYARHYQPTEPETGSSESTSENHLTEEQSSSSPSAAFASPEDPIDPTGDSEQLEATISQVDPYLTGAPTGSYHPEGETSSMSVAHGYSYAHYDIGGAGRETPKASARTAAEPPEEYHALDNASARFGSTREYEMHDGYVVAHSSMFKPGEVFKILWCEPLGAGGPKSEVITNWVGMQVNGRQFYQGFRRFIVVANDEGHCTCVPILTYEHKACTKRGVKPSKHGIVYQVGKRPRMVEGEPKLGFQPVRVELYERTEKLDKESRVNYAKLTTVEHNFRVFFIGRIVPEDFNRIVGPAVEECWNRKRRHNH